jgi:hypothetical protein
MADNNQGRHLAPAPGKKPAAVGATILIALLVAVYLGLCGYVEITGRIMPNTAAAGVPLGGLTRAQAAQQLGLALSVRYATGRLHFPMTASTRTAPVSSDSVSVDIDAAAAAAWRVGREHGFLLQGWSFLSCLLSGRTVDAPLRFTDEAAIDALIAQAAAGIERPVEETTYTVTQDSLLLHKGTPGRRVDREC